MNLENTMLLITSRNVYKRFINLDFGVLFENKLTDEDLEAYFEQQLRDNGGDQEIAGANTLAYELSQAFISLHQMKSDKPKFVDDALDEMTWVIDRLRQIEVDNNMMESVINIPHLDIQIEPFIHTTYLKHIEEFLGVLAVTGEVDPAIIKECREKIFKVKEPFNNVEDVKSILQDHIMHSYSINKCKYIIDECASTTSTIYDIHRGLVKLLKRCDREVCFSFGYGWTRAAMAVHVQIQKVYADAANYGIKYDAQPSIIIFNSIGKEMAVNLVKICPGIRLVFPPNNNLFLDDYHYTIWRLCDSTAEGGFTMRANMIKADNQFGNLRPFNEMIDGFVTLTPNTMHPTVVRDLILDDEPEEGVTKVQLFENGPYFNPGYILRTLEGEMCHLVSLAKGYHQDNIPNDAVSVKPSIGVVIPDLKEFIERLITHAGGEATSSKVYEIESALWKEIRDLVTKINTTRCVENNLAEINLLNSPNELELDVDLYSDDTSLLVEDINTFAEMGKSTYMPSPMMITLIGNRSRYDPAWDQFIHKAITTMVSNGVSTGVIDLIQAVNPEEEEADNE